MFCNSHSLNNECYLNIWAFFSPLIFKLHWLFSIYDIDIEIAILPIFLRYRCKSLVRASGIYAFHRHVLGFFSASPVKLARRLQWMHLAFVVQVSFHSRHDRPRQLRFLSFFLLLAFPLLNSLPLSFVILTGAAPHSSSFSTFLSFSFSLSFSSQFLEMSRVYSR